MAAVSSNPELEKNNPLARMFGGMQGGNPFAFLAQLFQALFAMMKGEGGSFADLFSNRDANTPDADAPTGSGRGNRTTAPRLSAPRLAPVNANTAEIQTKVNSALADAAQTAGVSSDLMVGVWGKETQFSRLHKSPTGCLGPWQFTRTAMIERMSTDGATIAERLRAQGLNEQADLVTKVHEATKGMSRDQIKSFASRNARLVDDLRLSPEVSTYAAAFHLKANANTLKLDAQNPDHFGMIYAGYNIGPGNAQKIIAGQRATGWEVNANSGVAGGTTAAAQRASYHNAVHSYLNTAQGKEFATIARGEAPATPTATILAYAPATPAPAPTAKPATGLDAVPSLREQGANKTMSQTGGPAAEPVVREHVRVVPDAAEKMATAPAPEQPQRQPMIVAPSLALA